MARTWDRHSQSECLVLIKKSQNQLFAEDKVNCANHADGSISKISIERLFHDEDREEGEDHHRDHFLDDFQLGERKVAVADSIRRNLKTILEESNCPASKDCDPKWF